MSGTVAVARLSSKRSSVRARCVESDREPAVDGWVRPVAESVCFLTKSARPSVGRAKPPSLGGRI